MCPCGQPATELCPDCSRIKSYGECQHKTMPSKPYGNRTNAIRKVLEGKCIHPITRKKLLDEGLITYENGVIRLRE